MNELVQIVAEVANKDVKIRHIEGPVGVESRNFGNAKIFRTGWKPRISLREGIARTYPWIEQQVMAARGSEGHSRASLTRKSSLTPQ